MATLRECALVKAGTGSHSNSDVHQKTHAVPGGGSPQTVPNQILLFSSTYVTVAGFVNADLLLHKIMHKPAFAIE